MAEESGPDGADYAALVRGLLKDLAGTSITRLVLRHGDLRLALRRLPGALVPLPADAMGEPAADERPAHWQAVEAPLTGIFYLRASPDEEPYVQVGSAVEPDTVVGLIETMKMFNPVTADVRGIVREIALDSGSLVEAGQAVLYVEPGDDASGPPVGAA